MLNQNNVTATSIPWGNDSGDFALAIANANGPVVILIDVGMSPFANHAVAIQYNPCPSDTATSKFGTFAITNLLGKGITVVPYSDISEGYINQGGKLIEIEASLGGVAATGSKKMKHSCLFMLACLVSDSCFGYDTKSNLFALYQPFINQGEMSFDYIDLGDSSSEAIKPPIYKAKNGIVQKVNDLASLNMFLKDRMSFESEDEFYYKWLPNLVTLCLSKQNCKVIRATDLYLYNSQMSSELLKRYGDTVVHKSGNNYLIEFYTWVSDGQIDKWSLSCSTAPPCVLSADIAMVEGPHRYPDALLTRSEVNTKKLKTICLGVDIEKQSLKTVVGYIGSKSRQLDPDGIGVSTFFDFETDNKPRPISIHITNISLYQLCQIISNQAYVQFEVRDDGVHFSPIN